MRLLLTLFLCVVSCIGLQSKDLNFSLRVDASAIQSTNTERFESLQTEIQQFVENTDWSEVPLQEHEFLNVNTVLEITEQLPGNVYKANLEISATRPVFNATYTSNLFTHRETEFKFKFLQEDQLFFNENAFVSNLVSVVSFYLNIVFGLEAQSFMKQEGRSYFSKATKIASFSDAAAAEGWDAGSTEKFSRFRIANDLQDSKFASFLQGFYTYHRKGLDFMSQNPQTSRANILNALEPFTQYGTDNTPLVHIFFNTKIVELVNIFKPASDEEKTKLKKIVKEAAPTFLNQLNGLDQD